MLALDISCPPLNDNYTNRSEINRYLHNFFFSDQEDDRSLEAYGIATAG